MADQDGKSLLLVAGVAVAAFLVGKYVLTAAPVQVAAQALTPQPPSEAGVVLRGKSYAAFIPLPFLSDFFSSGMDSGAVARTTDYGSVLVQPGQRLVAVSA